MEALGLQVNTPNHMLDALELILALKQQKQQSSLDSRIKRLVPARASRHNLPEGTRVKADRHRGYHLQIVKLYRSFSH